MARTRAALEGGVSALRANVLDMPESDYLPEKDMTGVSNEAYANAVGIGGPAGELSLRESIVSEQLAQSQVPAYEQAPSYNEDYDYGL